MEYRKSIEHGPQWQPKHFLGKRLEVNLDFLGEEDEYLPFSADDAIATVRDSRLFEDYDGHPGQQAMIEDDARLRWPELFAAGAAQRPGRSTPVDLQPKVGYNNL